MVTISQYAKPISHLHIIYNLIQLFICLYKIQFKPTNIVYVIYRYQTAFNYCKIQYNWIFTTKGFQKSMADQAGQ